MTKKLKEVQTLDDFKKIAEELDQQLKQTYEHWKKDYTDRVGSSDHSSYCKSFSEPLKTEINRVLKIEGVVDEFLKFADVNKRSFYTIENVSGQLQE